MASPPRDASPIVSTKPRESISSLGTCARPLPLPPGLERAHTFPPDFAEFRHSSIEFPITDDWDMRAPRMGSTKLKKRRSRAKLVFDPLSLRADNIFLYPTSFAIPPEVPLPESAPPSLARSDTSSVVSSGLDSPTFTGENDSSEDGKVKDAKPKPVFDDLNRISRRGGLPHHPFSSAIAPYMQSYTPAMLDNDYHALQLYLRLTPGGSPSFHSYNKPPTDVLDLGCGAGYWVEEAARAWKGSRTRVTAFDLIDIPIDIPGDSWPNLDPNIAKRIKWVRGNFVSYALPFPDESFDHVRMANLTLCIPRDSWIFVLQEVRRVLRRGGRLELIDDSIFFPALSIPVPLSRPPPHPPSEFDDDSDDETPTGTPTPSKAMFTEFDILHESPAKIINQPPPRPARRVPLTEDQTNIRVAKSLEDSFMKMLPDKYSIDPCPHELLEFCLHQVFGPENFRQSHNIKLAIPSRELVEGENEALSTDHDAQSRTWAGLEWEKKVAEIVRAKAHKTAKEHVQFPVNSSPKALQMLGGVHTKAPSLARSNSFRADRSLQEKSKASIELPQDMSAKAVKILLGRENARPQRGKQPYQPPGLLLLPSTLLPFTPAELDMHAFKNMNILIGCKVALLEYIQEWQDAEQRPWVSDTEFEAFLWDYEMFRRPRFQWPADYVGLQFDDEPVKAPTPSRPLNLRLMTRQGESLSLSKRPRALSSGTGQLDTDATKVRVIHVYDAVKNGQ